MCYKVSYIDVYYISGHKIEVQSSGNYSLNNNKPLKQTNVA